MTNNYEELTKAVRDLERRFDELDADLLAKTEDWQQWRSDTARALNRVTTILIGDAEIQHRGLVDRVAEHSTFIINAKGDALEKRGSKKMLILICGLAGALLGKIVEAAITLYASKGH